MSFVHQEGVGAVVKMSLRNSGVIHKLRRGYIGCAPMGRRLARAETGRKPDLEKKKNEAVDGQGCQKACPARGQRFAQSV